MADQSKAIQRGIPEWKALDLVKALLVVGMIWVHSLFWLISKEDAIIDMSSRAYPLIPYLSLIGLLPLCIPIAAGAVLRLHFQRFLSVNRLVAYPLRSILMVCLFLVLAGFLINGAAFGLDDIFSWDVLGFVAISYLCTIALARIHIYAVFFVGIAVLVSSELVVSLLSPNENYLSGILIGGDAHFYWPFFPWFFVFSFGVFIAHVWIEKNRFETIVALIGAAMIVIASLERGLRPAINPANLWGLDIFQPGIYFILGLVGVFCILILGAEIIGRWVKMPQMIVHGFSRGILLVYGFHLIAGYHLAPLVKNTIPEGIALLFFPLAMILLSWCVGFLFVKYLYKKQLRIILKKSRSGEGF